MTTRGSNKRDRTCTACAARTYSGRANLSRCSSWAKCPKGTGLFKEGTATTDRQCTDCKMGKFSSTFDENKCENWSNCKRGTGLAPIETCPAGFAGPTFSRRLTAAEPTTEQVMHIVDWFIGSPGESCTETCRGQGDVCEAGEFDAIASEEGAEKLAKQLGLTCDKFEADASEIGRASCRERV